MIEFILLIISCILSLGVASLVDWLNKRYDNNVRFYQRLKAYEKHINEQAKDWLFSSNITISSACKKDEVVWLKDLQPETEFPPRVEFEVKNIVGASSGMMFINPINQEAIRKIATT